MGESAENTLLRKTSSSPLGILLVLGLTGAGGGGLGGMISGRGSAELLQSNRELAAKLDQVLEAQKRTELKLAAIEGAGTEAKVREQDDRLRKVENAIAALRALLPEKRQ